MDKTGPSIGARVLAALVLALAAWLLLKAVIGVVAGLAWLVAVGVLLIAVVGRCARSSRRPPGMLFLLVSLFFGVLGGVIGRSKGNSFLLWFVIAAIPPYIGVLAAILYRSQHDEPHRACPSCGKSCCTQTRFARAVAPSSSSRGRAGRRSGAGTLTR